jgi:hypothetical protein
MKADTEDSLRETLADVARVKAIVKDAMFNKILV